MPRRRVFDDQSRRFSWPFSVRKLFPATIVNMSYEKATYTTLDIHEWDCSDGLCGDQYSEPGLNSKEKVSKALELIDKKTKAVGKKMQDVTAEIDRLERALRTVDEDAYNRRSQCLLLAKVTALSGMLHMLLRYTLVLRNDRKTLEYLRVFTDCPRKPLPRVNFSSRAELSIMESAPDHGSLLLANVYPDSDYSIIPEMFRGVLNNL